MSGTSSGNPFMMASSNLLNPPGIEKILDTTLTKVNVLIIILCSFKLIGLPII